MASEKRTLRLLVLGDPDIDKTSLIRLYMRDLDKRVDDVDSKIPAMRDKVVQHSIEANLPLLVSTSRFHGSRISRKNVAVEIFDNSYSCIPSLPQPMDAIVVAFDFTSENASESIKKWVYLLVNKGLTAPIFLVGTNFEWVQWDTQTAAEETSKKFRQLSALLSFGHGHPHISYIGCTVGKHTAPVKPKYYLTTDSTNHCILHDICYALNAIQLGHPTRPNKARNSAVIGGATLGLAVGGGVWIVAMLVVASLSPPVPFATEGMQNIMRLTIACGGIFAFLSTLLGSFLGYLSQKVQQKEEAMPSSLPPIIDDDNEIECVNWDDYHSQLTQALDQISEESGYSDLLPPGKEVDDSNNVEQHPPLTETEYTLG